MKYRSFSQRVFVLVMLAAISIAATAQQTQNVPSVERLREHVTYLASDKLAGRRTGSDGANQAAEYIANEFARYGLRRSIGRDLPGMSRLEADSPRRYMQQFPYVAGLELGKANELVFEFVPKDRPKSAPLTSARKEIIKVGEDWMPLGFPPNSRIENAPVVLVGYGITAAELNYDDYAKSGAAGKIAIAFAGSPDGDNPHGRFARYEGIRWKAIAAKNAGAKALVVIAGETNFKDDRLSLLRYDNSTGNAGLPVIAISRQAGERLLSADSSLLAEVEQKLKVQKPASPVSPVSENPQVPVVPGHTVSITLSTDVVRREAPAWNVVGILDGSDPSLRNEAIVIGAHYDHLGLGGEGSLSPRAGGIHHGADDNASGVAGVLELARLFSGQTPKPRRTLVFIGFGGEEEGLLGSNYYVNNPVVPLANTVAMINMDMIGRMKNNHLVIGGVGTAQDFRSMITSLNLAMGVTVTAGGGAGAKPVSSTAIPIVVGANGQTVVASDPGAQFTLTLNEDGFGPSDHSSFYAKQIPVLFLWTGTHEDYHKPSDTAEKINYEGEALILKLVTRIVKDIDNNNNRPAPAVAKTEATGRSTGFRVYLGTIPNYGDSNDGLLLDGVREDSPAARAGIKAGDKITKLAGRDVKNVYDYTYALGEMKAGQEYEAEVLRGSERLTFKITPAARR